MTNESTPEPCVAAIWPAAASAQSLQLLVWLMGSLTLNLGPVCALALPCCCLHRSYWQLHLSQLWLSRTSLP